MHDISPGTVIGRVWEIYKGQFATLMVASAVVSLVNLLAALLLGGFAGIVNIVLSLFFVGAVVQLVRDIDDGRRDEELGSLLKSVVPVFWPLLAIALLAGIAIAIGFLLLIIPGLILITIWAVAVPVCVLERPGVFASFGRSRALVRGHGWSVFGAIVLAWLIVIGVHIGGAVLAAPLGAVGRAVVDWALSTLLLPLPALVQAVLYFRLRRIKGEDQPAREVTVPA